MTRTAKELNTLLTSAQDKCPMQPAKPTPKDVASYWTCKPWQHFHSSSNGRNSLLNRRGVDWKFFREAHCSSVERVTQQADQSDACEHNARRDHTTGHMQSLQFHHQGVEQDRKKSRQDNRKRLTTTPVRAIVSVLK